MEARAWGWAGEDSMDEGGSTADDLRGLGDREDVEDRDVLRTLEALGARRRSVPSNVSELRPDGRSPRPRPRVGRRTREELIEESRLIREECQDLVNLYESALRGESEVRPPRRRTMPKRRRHAPRGDDHSSSDRRKALLIMLIEELL